MISTSESVQNSAFLVRSYSDSLSFIHVNLFSAFDQFKQYQWNLDNLNPFETFAAPMTSYFSTYWIKLQKNQNQSFVTCNTVLWVKSFSPLFTWWQMWMSRRKWRRISSCYRRECSPARRVAGSVGSGRVSTNLHLVIAGRIEICSYLYLHLNW